MRKGLARRVAVYSLALMLGAMLLGAPVLNFFGITLPALRIAGGLLVALAGYEMLTEPDLREDEHVAPVTALNAQAMAFFPLTMPLTVGPGTIAVSIALGAQDEGGLIGQLHHLVGSRPGRPLHLCLLSPCRPCCFSHRIRSYPDCHAAECIFAYLHRRTDDANRRRDMA